MTKFKSKFYTANRLRLARQLPNSIIAVAAHSALQLSADLAYPFRQDSSFWYLTGLNEPNAILIIDTQKEVSTLLLPEQSDYQKTWDGEINHTALKKISGVENIGLTSDLKTILQRAKSHSQQVCYLAPLSEVVEPYGFYANPSRKKLEEKLKEGIRELRDIRLELARLRQIKQPVELQAIKKAISITGETLKEVRAKLKNFALEKDLERAISAGFFNHGGDGHAYEPIIASGKNAATIHYGANSSRIQHNELLLLDVGVRVEGYAADISRTWAVGRPTKKQERVYEAVYELQQQAFKLLGPGVLLKEYQQEMEKRASRAMKNLGWTLGRYPHGFSHFLGLDVHDAGDYHSPLTLGSVLTVEPGLYSASEGIGVRLEDNVLIVENGIRNLSAAIPKVLHN